MLHKSLIPHPGPEFVRTSQHHANDTVTRYPRRALEVFWPQSRQAIGNGRRVEFGAEADQFTLLEIEITETATIHLAEADPESVRAGGERGDTRQQEAVFFCVTP